MADIANPLKTLFGRFRGKREVDAPPEIAVGSNLPDVDVQMLSEGGGGATAVTLADAMSNGTAILVGMPGAFTPVCTGKHLPSILSNLDALKAVGVDSVSVITLNDAFVSEAWRDLVVGKPDIAEDTESAEQLDIIVEDTEESTEQPDITEDTESAEQPDIIVEDTEESTEQPDITEDTESTEEGASIASADVGALKVAFLTDADGDAVKALGLLDDMGFGVGVRSKRFSIITQNYTVKYVAVDEGMDACDNSSITSVLDFLTPDPIVEDVPKEETDNKNTALIAAGAILALGALLASSTDILSGLQSPTS
jgi:peroxiredoxin